MNNSDVTAVRPADGETEQSCPSAEDVADASKNSSGPETGSVEAKGDVQLPSKVIVTDESIESVESVEKPIENSPDQDGEIAPAAASLEASESSLTPPPPPPPSEGALTAADLETFIANAITAKTEATEAYKKSDLLTARLKYLAALENLQVRISFITHTHPCLHLLFIDMPTLTTQSAVHTRFFAASARGPVEQNEVHAVRAGIAP
jgi:hypothetical protein